MLSNVRLARPIRLILRINAAQLHHLDVLQREGRGLRCCRVARFLALLRAQLQVIVHVGRRLLERVRANQLRGDGLAHALQLGTERLLRFKVVRDGPGGCVMLTTRVQSLHTLRVFVVTHLVNLVVATISALICRVNACHRLLEQRAATLDALS